MRLQPPRQAVDVVDDDYQPFSAVLAQILQHGLHAGALNHRAGLLVLEGLNHRESFVSGKLPAACCLGFQPVALLELRLG